MNARFIIILVVVVGVLFGIFYFGGGTPDKADPINNSGNEYAGTKHEDQGQSHIAEGAEHAPYNSNPPSSGPHHSSPAEWGVYEEPIADETLVHNLEHGGIVIAYKPDIGEEKISQLKEIFNRLPESERFGTIKAVLVPRAANSQPVQLAAWTYTLELDEVNEEAIRGFYQNHIDKGPELVP